MTGQYPLLIRNSTTVSTICENTLPDDKKPSGLFPPSYQPGGQQAGSLPLRVSLYFLVALLKEQKKCILIKTIQSQLQYRIYGAVYKNYYRVHPKYCKNNYFSEIKVYNTNLEKEKKRSQCSFYIPENWHTLKDNHIYGPCTTGLGSKGP